MIEFKDIELEDKVWVDELLSYSDFRGCEYSFGNNFIWRSIYNMKIARYKDFYLIHHDKGYFFPAGKGDLKEVVEELKKHSENDGNPLCITTMNKLSMEWLKETYCESIEITTNRDLYDYIYNYNDLSTLGGKKLHSKRNHINRFKENNWRYEKITPLNIAECKEMSTKWCELNNGDDKEKVNEACAVNDGLKNYFKLGFVGGLLKVDEKVHAFTFGEKLNSDTFVVHVEKAFTEIQGSYPAINFEFINNECFGYKYINREEDMGLENLRKSKLSYRPVFLEEKFMVSFK